LEASSRTPEYVEAFSSSANPLQSIIQYGHDASKQLEAEGGSRTARLPLHIAWDLRNVLSTTNGREEVMQLKGHQAQCMVSVMQLVHPAEASIHLMLTRFTVVNNLHHPKRFSTTSYLDPHEVIKCQWCTTSRPLHTRRRSGRRSRSVGFRRLRGCLPRNIQWTRRRCQTLAHIQRGQS
jgi:hypothetical protein